MATIVLIIHLVLAIFLIAVVLLQRSEGGALGIGGGGGGGGGLFSRRGTGNLLTRTTTILAAVFFGTSVALTLIARSQSDAPSILDTTGGAAPVAPVGDDATRGTGEGILDTLRQQSEPAEVPAPAGPQVPIGE